MGRRWRPGLRLQLSLTFRLPAFSRVPPPWATGPAKWRGGFATSKMWGSRGLGGSCRGRCPAGFHKDQSPSLACFSGVPWTVDRARGGSGLRWRPRLRPEITAWSPPLAGGTLAVCERPPPVRVRHVSHTFYSQKVKFLVREKQTSSLPGQRAESEPLETRPGCRPGRCGASRGPFGLGCSTSVMSPANGMMAGRASTCSPMGPLSTLATGLEPGRFGDN